MAIFLWIGFIVFVMIMLALDLGVFNRRQHTISIKESLAWTAVWIALALVFNVLVYFIYKNNWLEVSTIAPTMLDEKTAAIQFLTAYLIEKSLSLDNIFVFALIFSYFNVPSQYQHRVLYWGILGALIMRGIFIAAGAVLIHKFDWIVYVFGAILIIGALKLAFTDNKSIEPEKNPIIRLARRFLPVSNELNQEHFFVKKKGKHYATPLFLVLLLVESSDVMFAVDSIPAVFAVTSDPFIVFTSNVFAILGLRALYFAIAGILRKFRFLHLCLVLILGYVGVKMIISHHYKIPTLVSLSIIVGILVVGIAASILFPLKEEYEEPHEQKSEGTEPRRSEI